MIKEIKILLADEQRTLKLGKNLSKNVSKGLLIFLKGELGVGKTTLVRGFLNSLGYKGRVKSPTYSLVEQYSIGKYSLNHFDLYRFNVPEEWIASGFNEYIDDVYINIIEWPEKASDIISAPDLIIEIQYEKNNTRSVNIFANTKKGVNCCLGLN